MYTLKRKFLLLLTLSCVCTISLKAQESIMPQMSYTYLEKLIQTAQNNYPEVKVLQTRTALAKTEIGRTNVSWFDAFSVSYYYRPNNSSGDISTLNPYTYNGYQFGLNINLGTLFQKPFATKEAKQQYKIAQLTQQEYTLTLADQVKERYFLYLEQQAQLRLRTHSYTDAEALVKQLKFKFEKGEIEFDVYQRSLLLLTEQNQNLIHAESQVFVTKSALEQLLGQKLETIK